MSANFRRVSASARTGGARCVYRRHHRHCGLALDHVGTAACRVKEGPEPDAPTPPSTARTGSRPGSRGRQLGYAPSDSGSGVVKEFSRDRCAGVSGCNDQSLHTGLKLPQNNLTSNQNLVATEMAISTLTRLSAAARSEGGTGPTFAFSGFSRSEFQPAVEIGVF
jgi:hypothetical protein